MQRLWPHTRFAWMIVAALLALAGTLLLPTRTHGQKGVPTTATPRLFLVMPCGGQAGTSLEITVTGQNLDGIEGLLFSQPGIRAEYLGAGSSPQVAMKGKGKKKLQTPSASQRFKVTIPPGTPVGIHDVRVVSKSGISNPRAFAIGDHKEFAEKEPNNDVPEAQRIDLNASVSGLIATATDVDYYVFHGKKGQRVVLSCLTTSIDSRLPVLMEVYDSAGTHLATNRNYRDTDALCDVTLPDDGEYYVRLCSFAYTLGGVDYFYRLTVSTAPWIDAVFPPMVEPGKTTQVTVYGRNLPGGQLDPSAVVDGRTLEKAVVTVKAPGDATSGQRLNFSGRVAPPSAALDGFELRLRNGAGASNPMLLAYAHGPVVRDRGDNDTAEQAQRLNVPCEVAGRFEKRADRDWYVFHARKGQVFSIEVQGERLGAPLDLHLDIRRAGATKVLIDLDDSTDILSPQFYTRSDDPPHYRFVAPAEDDYLIQVSGSDSYSRASPRSIYRLRIAPEQPDFRVIAMPPGGSIPDAAAVGQGGHQLFNLLILRLDGFTGDVRVIAEGLPPGITAAPQTIPAGVKQAPFVVSADLKASPWSGAIRLRATANVGGKKLVREVRAATVTWAMPQPNLPAMTRLDRALVLAVRDRAPYSLTVASERRLTAPGKRVTVPIKLTRLRSDFKSAVQVTALDLPKGVTLKPFTVPAGKDRAEAVFDVKTNVAAGSYTFVLRGQAQGAGGKKKGKQPVNLALVQPSAPIRITIVPKDVAKLTINPVIVKVKRGARAELTIKVKRLHNYAGEFKVRLILPRGTKGLSAAEATIPAGQDETRLVVTAARDAPTGARSGLKVEAVAVFDEMVPLTHSAKLNVSVAK